VQSNLQGTDAKFVFGAVTPNQTLEIAPLIGFNYMHYSNEFLIHGSDAATATNHRIESTATNHIFGPEVGFRMEARSKWLTLGFEPKFTFGVNRVSNRVSTQQIFSPTELDRVQKDGLTRFSPVIELGTYARVRLAEHLNFTLGYQFMATTNVSQSEQNISWDSSSILANPPQINLIQREDDFWMQGINVGLQWQF
jgi:Putative beta barrel porin-7 (BBP7)